MSILQASARPLKAASLYHACLRKFWQKGERACLGLAEIPEILARKVNRGYIRSAKNIHYLLNRLEHIFR